jgi:hypothetical protein
MTTPAPVDPAIVRYLEVRDAERAARRNAAWSALTDREQKLVREAAVMGYVHGAMAPKGSPVPPDSQIVANVIDGCLGMPDLYPVLGLGGDL